MWKVETVVESGNAESLKWQCGKLKQQLKVKMWKVGTVVET